MRREYQLGRAAWLMAGFSPAFAAELFGRDIRHRDELTYSRHFLGHQRPDAARIESGFLALDQEPAAPDRPRSESERDAEHWVMLKRYLWRWGLWDAAHDQTPRFAPLAQSPALP